ncbi:hypothetical protein [Streptomyces specialis]|uniref:hypothetical protein n=1 Tax=Streptomyces specialis TaxID=498367 RepID=UPI00073E14CF|nr:hypothetical protein [Streptomyces specialis]
MVRWGLIVEEVVSWGQGQRWGARLLAEMGGTREEALAALWHHAYSYKPRHPTSPQGRLVFREADGFLVINKGATADYPCRFKIAELLWDTSRQGPWGQ